MLRRKMTGHEKSGPLQLGNGLNLALHQQHKYQVAISLSLFFFILLNEPKTLNKLFTLLTTAN